MISIIVITILAIILQPFPPHTDILPLFAQSLTDVLILSVPAVQLASLSLPRLRSDMGLKSNLPSRWGLEDMGMPYRKLDRTELLEVAGLDDVTTWAVVFPGPWLLGVMTAVEELWLTSVLDLASRDKSSAGLYADTKSRGKPFGGSHTSQQDIKCFVNCIACQVPLGLHQHLLQQQLFLRRANGSAPLWHRLDNL